MNRKLNKIDTYESLENLANRGTFSQRDTVYLILCDGKYAIGGIPQVVEDHVDLEMPYIYIESDGGNHRILERDYKVISNADPLFLETAQEIGHDILVEDCPDKPSHTAIRPIYVDNIRFDFGQFYS